MLLILGILMPLFGASIVIIFIIESILYFSTKNKAAQSIDL